MKRHDLYQGARFHTVVGVYTVYYITCCFGRGAPLSCFKAVLVAVHYFQLSVQRPDSSRSPSACLHHVTLFSLQRPAHHHRPIFQVEIDHAGTYPDSFAGALKDWILLEHDQSIPKPPVSSFLTVLWKA